MAEANSTPRPCRIDGCDRPFYRARGLCRGHYERFLRYGDAEHHTGRSIGTKTAPSQCSIDGCANDVDSKGFCKPHYDQSRRGRAKVGSAIREYRPLTERSAEGEKNCRRCGEWLPEDSFARSSRSPDGLQQWCRSCRSEHYRSQAEKVRDRMREARFGLTRDQFDALLAAQGGGCAICGTSDPGKAYWHVDHDHSCCPSSDKTCGKCVRGILCRACNHGIGNFRDDAVLLSSAAAYLTNVVKNRTTRRIVR